MSEFLRACIPTPRNIYRISARVVLSYDGQKYEDLMHDVISETASLAIETLESEIMKAFGNHQVQKIQIKKVVEILSKIV